MSEGAGAAAGFEEHRREQLRAIARGTTPAQRLAWLEEAMRLALQSGALQRERAARARKFEAAAGGLVQGTGGDQ